MCSSTDNATLGQYCDDKYKVYDKSLFIITIYCHCFSFTLLFIL